MHGVIQRLVQALGPTHVGLAAFYAGAYHPPVQLAMQHLKKVQLIQDLLKLNPWHCILLLLLLMLLSKNLAGSEVTASCCCILPCLLGCCQAFLELK
jgi:hypothetical protein